MSKIRPHINTNDTSYGLKTAAKIVHDKVAEGERKKVARERSRIQWENGRRRAIGQQRLKDYDRKAARLAELGTEASEIEALFAKGQVADNRKAQVERRLEQVRERMNRLEDDLTTLRAEIEELAAGIQPVPPLMPGDEGYDVTDEIGNILADA